MHYLEIFFAGLFSSVVFLTQQIHISTLYESITASYFHGPWWHFVFDAPESPRIL